MEEKKIFTDTKLLSSSSPSDNIGGSAVEPFDVDEEIALNENGQHDRLKLVYWIMLIHGVGVLMPWNMFITAQDYFIHYKFGGRCSDYSRNFLSYLGVCAQLPNVLLSGLNFVFHFGGSLTKRIVFCICIIIAIFIFTAILAMVDTSDWTGGSFFAVTMVSIAILNSATGIYQNCVYGVAAAFPFSYTNAVIMGNNLSGTWTAIISIITIAAAPSQRTAAIYYFLTAVVVLLICLDSYFVLPHCRFYRHHKLLNEKHHKEENERLQNLMTSRERLYQTRWQRFKHALIPYVTVMKQAWMQLFNVFFVFFVTLTIFPAIQADIGAMSDELRGTYFTPVTAFLFFNLFAMIGNVASHWTQVPGVRWVWVPVLLRVFMIPYFMFCNYRADFRTFPVLITNDYAYIAMGILMAFTSGYFSGIVMQFIPGVVDKHLKSMAGMMGAFFLVLGINCGLMFSRFVAYIVENLGPLPPLANSTTACEQLEFQHYHSNLTSF